MAKFQFPAMAQRQVGDKLNVSSKRFEWDGVKWKPVVTSGIPVEAPTINLIDTGSDYITVTFTNNDEDPVRFLYEIDDDTPDANILELNGEETSSNITFSDLSQDTSYTIFLTPVIEGKVVETSNLEQPTLRVTENPTITNTSRTHTSISFRINNPHDYEVTAYYEIGDSSPDANQVTIAANDYENITISGLTSNTSYTVYVYTVEEDKVASSVVSQSISTLTYTTATPTITITNVSADSVSFNLKNNDGSTVTMYYEVNDSTPDTTVTVNAGQTVSRTVSGLNPTTGYTLYARAKASNENMSSTTSSGFTTGAAFRTLPWVGRNGNKTYSTSPWPIGDRYFTSDQDIVVPNYPQYMNLYGPPPSQVSLYYPNDSNGNTDLNYFSDNNLDYVGETFAIKFVGTLPHTPNSCATAAHLGFTFADGEKLQIIGSGGNKTGCASGCGRGSVPCTRVYDDGRVHKNVATFGSSTTFTAEQTSNLQFKINGTVYKTGVKLIAFNIYGGYTGTTSNTSSSYKVFGTLSNFAKTGAV